MLTFKIVLVFGLANIQQQNPNQMVSKKDTDGYARVDHFKCSIQSSFFYNLNIFKGKCLFGAVSQIVIKCIIL